MTGNESTRGPRWRVGLAVGTLAAAAAVLAGLYVDAAAGRADERRRAGDLAANVEALRAETAALRADRDAARDRAVASDARFTAVEPCLRQVVATPTPGVGPKVRSLTEAELRELLRLRPADGYQVLTGAMMFPACKDVARQLK